MCEITGGNAIHSAGSATWIWLVNYLHLHLHLHLRMMATSRFRAQEECQCRWANLEHAIRVWDVAQVAMGVRALTCGTSRGGSVHM